MKMVVQINTVSNGSTGRIMRGIADLCNSQQSIIKNLTVCSRDTAFSEQCDRTLGLPKERFLHKILAHYSGLSEIYSSIGTFLFIRWLQKMKPDIIHFHNLHGWYINIPLLVRYIKKNNTPVVWTMHDCWGITGRCPHFTISKCTKWQKKCAECDYPKQLYPTTKKQKEGKMWEKKRKWFTSINNLTIVCPSQWLSEIVGRSFLSNKKTVVINNGIDLDVFRPSESDFRTKHHLEEKYILLGVAFDWSYRKGLDVFVELACVLPEYYQIVLVGTNATLDQELPDNIISIHRTDNQKELAKIYSAADLFLNPTREDTYPTVNMESIACGTPVVTFNTGGSCEMINSSTGRVVKSNTVEEMIDWIYDYHEGKVEFDKKTCVTYAKHFSKHIKYQEYIDLYASILDVEKNNDEMRGEWYGQPRENISE